MNKKVFRILIAISLILFVVIAVHFSIPFIKYIKSPDKLRDYIESFGSLAPIVYMLLMMLQIFVPFIPGEPFELLAGYIFGFVEGTILCLLAGSIASICIILLVKKFGTNYVEMFFSKKDYTKLNHLKSKRAFFVYSILFILPGTPKDLLCYFGGLANYDLIPLIIVTTLGRIPSVITSTIPGDALSQKKHISAIVIYAVTIVVCLISAYIYNKNVNKKR